MTVKLDLDDLKETEQARVVLTHSPSNRTWVSYIQDDFSIGTGAEYSAPFEDLLSSAREFLGQASIIAGENARELIPIPSRQNTTLTWVSSERPSFAASLVFIAAKNDDRPQQEAVDLTSYCLPTTPTEATGLLGLAGTDDQGEITDSVLASPGGYGFEGRNPVGTFTLNVGNWFIASQLVLTSADMNLAAVRTSTGQPLYAEVEVQLEPWRMISAEEFRNYFRIGRVGRNAAADLLPLPGRIG